MYKEIKQTRYVSANSKMKFRSSINFFEEMQERLACACECDGKGCSICIGADAFKEAITLLKLKS